ncbi:MAG: 6-bladed beta-propeller [Bacteroidales bacterium]|nr:6-bladed beta-propeller [Bacteroidales bacterium]
MKYDSLFIAGMLASVVAISFSCSHSSCNENSECKKIDMAYEIDNAQVVNLSKYATKIEYIPLETGAGSMLGRVVSVVEGEGCYYLSGSDECAKAFDRDGKFLGDVGVIGRGPGEVQIISTLLYDEKNNGVALVSGNKVVVYNPVDNSVIKVIDTRVLEGCRAVGCRANGDYIMYGFDRDSITNNDIEKYILISSEGDVLEERTIGPNIPTQGEFRGIPIIFAQGYAVFMSGDNLYAMSSSRDTLYRIDDKNGKEAEFLFDFGKYTSKTRLNEPGMRLMMYPHKVDTKDFTMFALGGVRNGLPSIVPDGSIQRGDGYVLLDKQEKRFYVLKHDSRNPLIGFRNDIDGGMNFTPTFSTADKMFRVENADKFIEYASQSSSSRMKEVAATLTEESNPVLVVVTLK